MESWLIKLEISSPLPFCITRFISYTYIFIGLVAEWTPDQLEALSGLPTLGFFIVTASSSRPSCFSLLPLPPIPATPSTFSFHLIKLSLPEIAVDNDCDAASNVRPLCQLQYNQRETCDTSPASHVYGCHASALVSSDFNGFFF